MHLYLFVFLFLSYVIKGWYTCLSSRESIKTWKKYVCVCRTVEHLNQWTEFSKIWYLAVFNEVFISCLLSLIFFILISNLMKLPLENSSKFVFFFLNRLYNFYFKCIQLLGLLKSNSLLLFVFPEKFVLSWLACATY